MKLFDGTTYRTTASTSHDLTDARRIIVTSGPVQGFIGTVVRVGKGNYKAHNTNSVNVTRVFCRNRYQAVTQLVLAARDAAKKDNS